MKFQDLDLDKRYTYSDYLTWKFDETVELIRGKIFRMSPAPGTGHQYISTRLLTRMGYFFEERSCQVFHAPFDVRLPLPPERRSPEQIDTVVQPDISVICDPEKIDERGCLGPPDWIIEILSPGTAKKDIRDKFEVYEFSGVREYWIIHPANRQVMAYALEDSGRYAGRRPYIPDEKISPVIFPDLVIDLAEIFPDRNLVAEEWVDYGRE